MLLKQNKTKTPPTLLNTLFCLDSFCVYVGGSLTRAQLSATPRTAVARQAPLSMAFQPGKNTGVGCHAAPRPGIELGSPAGDIRKAWIPSAFFKRAQSSFPLLILKLPLLDIITPSSVLLLGLILPSTTARVPVKCSLTCLCS